MSGGEGTSGKSGSSPNLCNSGLFSTDQRRHSLSRASAVVVDVDRGTAVVVVAGKIVVPNTGDVAVIAVGILLLLLSFLI